MDYIDFTIGILLLIHGIYSLIASYKGKETIHWELPSTTYLSQKIFGKKFDKWHNFFWGFIEVSIGVFLIYLYFN